MVENEVRNKERKRGDEEGMKRKDTKQTQRENYSFVKTWIRFSAQTTKQSWINRISFLTTVVYWKKPPYCRVNAFIEILCIHRASGAVINKRSVQHSIYMCIYCKCACVCVCVE